MLIIDALDNGVGESWSKQSIQDEERRAVMALNKTAQTAAADIKIDMPGRFTIRNKWVQKGIRVDKASVDNPVARVYSVDPYMLKQEEGQSYNPDGHVAIPYAARPSPKSIISRKCSSEARHRKRKSAHKRCKVGWRTGVGSSSPTALS